MNYVQLVIVLLSCVESVSAFVTVLPRENASVLRSSTTFVQPSQPTTTKCTAFSRQLILGAGFGGGGDSKKKKKESKLKPKKQWDRYTTELKKEKPFRVAVQQGDEWLEVGNVKSKGGELTKAAVARQRALIAEHARRLFPLQVSTKSKTEWALWDVDNEDWVIVDKAILDEDSMPDSLEKMIGFEGRPDPATGFYCMYNEGKLVNSDDDMKRTSSKKVL